MIQANKLIEKFQYALDNHWGYIYGMSHELWSMAKQEQYAREYAGDPDREQSVRYGGKWDGCWVTDCSGLFKWAFSQLGGSIAHGSNSIWDRYCSDKGDLARGKRSDGKELLPGTAVFTTSGEKHNHIGLYIGGDTVIEAQGTQAGVVTSKITDKKWSAWGELKAVTYSGGEEVKMKAIVVLPSGAKGNTVNMREQPNKSADIVCRVPVGATVDVSIDRADWCYIEYEGKTGWMMSNYLEYEDQGGESETIELSEEDRARIDASLKAIENAVDEIGRIVGRG